MPYSCMGIAHNNDGLDGKPAQMVCPLPKVDCSDIDSQSSLMAAQHWKREREREKERRER